VSASRFSSTLIVAKTLSRCTNISVRIISADDGSRPDTAVNAARRLITDGASCVAGSIQSASTTAVANGAAVPAGVALIAPASTSAQITDLHGNGLVFRIAPSDLLQGPVLANAMMREIGPRSRLQRGARHGGRLPAPQDRRARAPHA
jgi:ABC-type branched-subunit amino acid transport system substrate-binding protein